MADSTGKVLNQVGGSSLEVAYTDLLVDFVCEGGLAIFCNSLIGGAAKNMAALDCGRAFQTLCIEKLQWADNAFVAIGIQAHPL